MLKRLRADWRHLQAQCVLLNLPEPRLLHFLLGILIGVLLGVVGAGWAAAF